MAERKGKMVEKANESEIGGGNVNWNSDLIDNITDDKDLSVNPSVNLLYQRIILSAHSKPKFIGNFAGKVSHQYHSRLYRRI